jgi:hypothetical protein
MPGFNVSQAGLLSAVYFEQLAHAFHKVLASHQKHGFDVILPVGFPLSEPCGLFELASILSRQFPRSPFAEKLQKRCGGQPFRLFGLFPRKIDRNSRDNFSRHRVALLADTYD